MKKAQPNNSYYFKIIKKIDELDESMNFNQTILTEFLEKGSLDTKRMLEFYEGEM